MRSPDKSAASVVTALFKVNIFFLVKTINFDFTFIQLFMRMGLPHVILSDNGKEFDNQLDSTLAWDCLVSGNMTPFPQRSRKRRNMQQEPQEFVDVYCTCRLPEQGRMVQCDSCHEWFHSGCIKKELPQGLWRKNSSVSWLCDLCV